MTIYRREKPAIPLPVSAEPDLRVFAESVKEWLEVVQGLRGNPKIAKLPNNASTSEIVAKVNELIDLLQG